MSPVDFSGLPARFLALSLALSCIGSSASAQEESDDDAPYYNGTWTARLRCTDGSACPARRVQDFAGTWQDLGGSSASKRACGGEKLLLTVQASTRSVLAFTAFGDGVSPACPTLTIVVKPVGAKALEGTVDTEGHRIESPRSTPATAIRRRPRTASARRRAATRASRGRSASRDADGPARIARSLATSDRSQVPGAGRRKRSASFAATRRASPDNARP